MLIEESVISQSASKQEVNSKSVSKQENSEDNWSPYPSINLTKVRNVLNKNGKYVLRKKMVCLMIYKW